MEGKKSVDRRVAEFLERKKGDNRRKIWEHRQRKSPKKEEVSDQVND